MNTNSIKKYAPQARREFMEAVGKRLNQFGVYTDKKGKALTISEPIFSGSVMQIDGNSFEAGLAQARKRLTSRVEKLGFDSLVEHVAYTWFNRLCAIRFMELKGDYLEHGLRVLSHPEKANGFELLDHAQDVAEDLGLDRNHIVELKLAGNKDEELYRHLLLGQCHKLHEAMPFLFEALDDETELLLPDNLTRTDSILRGLVDSIPEQDWQQVEIIGWLYQFYISEKKDQVIGSVVKSEDIPAATQLFTPNWIVKYLVQNSVGRQWLMTYPDSGLKALMEYYIEPAEQDASVKAALAAITPACIEPESIKVIDPACGSGHILVEAYDLLKAIYEERGYRSRDIPKLILENNLFGLDIDDRAAQLAGFALMMKAREDDRRIFTRDIKLNVLALQSTQDLNLPELWRKLALNKDAKRGMTESIFDNAQANLVDALDNANFTSLQSVLVLFEKAKTFGSLIQVSVDQADFLHDIKNQLKALIKHGDSFQKPAAIALFPFVQQAWLLAQSYDAVIANPPYMGAKFYNGSLKPLVAANYKFAKGDLYTCFMVRNTAFAKIGGVVGMITTPNWMFLSTFEEFRDWLFAKTAIETFSHNGRGVFGSDFGSCAFTFRHQTLPDYNGCYKRLFEKQGSVSSNAELEYRFTTSIPFKSSTTDFKKIPGSPVAYWVSKEMREAFISSPALAKYAVPRQGFATGENATFLRLWYEVSFNQIGFGSANAVDALNSKMRWFPCNKGGQYRKWYGNNIFIVDWESNGQRMKAFPGSVIRNPDYYFREGMTWSTISISSLSMRYSPVGFLFETKGSVCFPVGNESIKYPMGLMNTKVVEKILLAISPTLDFHEGPIGKIPLIYQSKKLVIDAVDTAIEISKGDWNTYETSWDFQSNPLLGMKGEGLGNSSTLTPNHSPPQKPCRVRIGYHYPRSMPLRKGTQCVPYTGNGLPIMASQKPPNHRRNATPGTKKQPPVHRRLRPARRT